MRLAVVALTVISRAHLVKPGDLSVGRIEAAKGYRPGENIFLRAQSVCSTATMVYVMRAIITARAHGGATAAHTVPTAAHTIPTAATSLPQRRTSFPRRRMPSPQRRMPFPRRRTSLPQRRTSFPQRRMSFPQRRTPFPQRRTPLHQRRTPLHQRRTPLHDARMVWRYSPSTRFSSAPPLASSSPRAVTARWTSGGRG
jgi:hypothetical protein